MKQKPFQLKRTEKAICNRLTLYPMNAAPLKMVAKNDLCHVTAISELIAQKLIVKVTLEIGMRQYGIGDFAQFANYPVTHNILILDLNKFKKFI